jgi:uncharacterized protein YgbK (DUF1537 family)
MMLRLIADDLTGALDAAAPFATPEQPVRLMLKLGAAVGDRVCFSTESRDLSAPTAVERTVSAQATLMQPAVSGAIWFKKVDSVLRGHPVAETLAMARAGGFATCVFAPAFPQMGRITRNGRQMLRNATGDWQDVGPGDLRRAFAETVPQMAPGLDLVVIDAEDQTELQQRILPWRGDPRVLWAGSRGLAEALVPGIERVVRPPVGAFILGTSHPATRAQAKGLAALRRGGPNPPSTDDPILLDPVPDCQNEAQTRARLAQTLARLAPPSDDSAFLVTGGDTLAILLQVVAAEALNCMGEVGPGLPMSRIIGGRLAGVRLISKSGGFGGSHLLSDMLE